MQCYKLYKRYFYHQTNQKVHKIFSIIAIEYMFAVTSLPIHQPYKYNICIHFSSPASSAILILNNNIPTSSHELSLY